jgi:DNA-directed RNA polymerase subunit RPC12/RpoP
LPTFKEIEMTKFVCAHCGGENVVRDAWYHPNTEEIQTFDDCYCLDCDESTTIEEEDDEDSDKSSVTA